MKTFISVIFVCICFFVTVSAEAQTALLVLDDDSFTPDLAVYSKIEKNVLLENFPATITFRVTKVLGHEGFSCFWDLTIEGPENWELAFDHFELDGKIYKEDFKTDEMLYESKRRISIYREDCRLLNTLTHKSTFRFSVYFVLNGHVISETFERKHTNHLKDFQWSARHRLQQYAEQSP